MPTATMTSTIQRPSRPPFAPPTSPLPSLPIPKTRTPLPDIPDNAEDRPRPSSSGLPTPSKLPARSVTVSSLPKPNDSKSYSTPSIPTLNTSFASPRPPTSPAPSQSSLPTLRKVSSIGAFPLPPKGAPRVSSLPPSPLSTSESTSDLNGVQQKHNSSRRDSAKQQKNTELGSKRVKTPRSSGYGLRPRASVGGATAISGTPSLLNGSGENSFISSAEGARGSDGFLSLPSPPASRSPSVDGSSNTDGTIFEDHEPDSADRGRLNSMGAGNESKGSSGPGKDSTKGNVIVSVRVRPDAGGGDVNTTDGEWIVDGRRSLVSYRGKEGGDYRYGG